MPLVSHKVTVQAPVERDWSMMLDKVEHPDLYVPGVEHVEIVRRPGDQAVERVMRTRQGDRVKEIHELISWNDFTRTVVFVKPVGRSQPKACHTEHVSIWDQRFVVSGVDFRIER